MFLRDPHVPDGSFHGCVKAFIWFEWCDQITAEAFFGRACDLRIILALLCVFSSEPGVKVWVWWRGSSVLCLFCSGLKRFYRRPIELDAPDLIRTASSEINESLCFRSRAWPSGRATRLRTGVQTGKMFVIWWQLLLWCAAAGPATLLVWARGVDGSHDWVDHDTFLSIWITVFTCKRSFISEAVIMSLQIFCFECLFIRVISPG